jgi:small GTP-binding protein
MEPSSNKQEEFDYLFKISLAGNSGVGKSSINRRYFGKSFLEDTTFTIGVEFDEKVVNIKGTKVKVQFWDCSGKKTYSTIVKEHLHDSHG